MLARRTLLLAAPRALAAPAVRREVFIASPAEGVAVMAFAFYTKSKGGDMISIEERWSRSDTIDIAYVRRSKNHGESWSAPTEMRTGERRPEGMLRRHPHAGFVDRHGRYVEFSTEGVLPSDDPLEGLRQWNIYYRTSNDGGQTLGPKTQIIQQGGEFNSGHPLTRNLDRAELRDARRSNLCAHLVAGWSYPATGSDHAPRI